MKLGLALIFLALIGCANPGHPVLTKADKPHLRHQEDWSHDELMKWFRNSRYYDPELTRQLNAK